MSEEINNNIVNNETNSNNNYEPPKSNNGVKVLLVVLIILVLCLIGLTAYKMLVFDKKNDNKKDNNVVKKDDNRQSNNAIEKNDNKHSNNAIEKNTNNNNEVKEDYDKINYEIKEELNVDGYSFKYLYVNDKKIEETETVESVKVEQYRDVLIVEVFYIDGNKRHLLVGNDGKVTELKDDWLKLERGWNNAESYRLENNNIYVKVRVQFSQGYLDAECRIADTSLISEYEVKYEYLGNGKISSGEVVNKKTIKDLYENSCNDVILFFDSGKWCTRKNNKIECYLDSIYENGSYEDKKSKLIELYGESNCRNKKYVNETTFHCQIGNKYCELENNGDIQCDGYLLDQY